MKSHTDLPQSKKLAEFLPIKSADMCFNTHNNMPPLMTPYSRFKEFYDMEPTPAFLIPCWSLAALMKLLPSEFTIKGEITYKIDIRKYALTDNVDIYQIAYGNYKWYEDGSRSWSDMINSGEREELIDACYDMIISLHEFKLL